MVLSWEVGGGGVRRYSQCYTTSEIKAFAQQTIRWIELTYFSSSAMDFDGIDLKIP